MNQTKILANGLFSPVYLFVSIRRDEDWWRDTRKKKKENKKNIYISF